MFTLGRSVQQLMHMCNHSQFWSIPLGHWAGICDIFCSFDLLFFFWLPFTPNQNHSTQKTTSVLNSIFGPTVSAILANRNPKEILFKLPSYPGRAGGRKIRRGSRSRLSSSPPRLPPRPTTTTPTAVRVAMGRESNSTRSNVKPRERFFQELTLLPQTMRWPCQHSEQ